MRNTLSRRRFLSFCGTSSLLLAGAPWGGTLSRAFGAETEPPFRIGICDWDLKATGNPRSFAVAKELGYDGVQVSYQPEGEFSLARSKNRTLFLEAAKQEGVAIASLAMGILNGKPLAGTPEAESWVENCIEALSEMNVSSVLLAFFGKGDMKNDPAARKSVVEKLKRLAPKAEKHKKILAVESTLNAEEHLEMLQAVGSDAVKVYYDEQNMLKQGYSIYEDLETLLKEKVVYQVHAKEYNARLGEGKIDFIKIKKLLEKYDYRDWIVVESSVQGNWKESQAANAAYLRKLFHP